MRNVFGTKRLAAMYVLVAAVLMIGSASASTIAIYSAGSTGPTFQVDPYQVEGNFNYLVPGDQPNYAINPLVVVPGSVWAPAQGGASWISYTPGTGADGVVVPNYTDITGVGGTGGPNAIFFDILTLPGGVSGYNVTLNVYADDTTGVSLFDPSFNLLALPNFTPGTYCAISAIGCISGVGDTGGHFSMFLTPGTYTFAFPTYQVSGSGYGLMFYGEAVPTPEPASMALLGTGLIGIAGAIRRKLIK
jgi:PEP-CTERM motif